MDDRAVRREEIGTSTRVGTWHGASTGAERETRSVSERPMLVPDSSGRSSAHFMSKRVIDIIGSAGLILLFLPLLPIVVLAIWLDSGRPIIYKQQRVRSKRVRVGEGWAWQLEDFTFYKFRTMYDGAVAATHQEYMEAYITGDESKLAELRPSDQHGPTYKLSEDSRVTRVGRLLRTTSLDELPQLWNVLLGHMSLVGPRPPIPYEVAMYRPQDMARFASVPGITGMWQVSGRSELSFESMIALDVDYIQRQSVALDLIILLRTIPAVFSRKGAG